MSLLTTLIQVLAYEDSSQTNLPLQKQIDWKRSLNNIPVQRPQTESIKVPPKGSKVLIDGTRTTSLGSNSEFSLTLSGMGNSYFITYTGGTNPLFRVDRSVSLSNSTLTITVLPNGLVSFVSSNNSAFTNVSVGDEVFIPGLSTGDSASPFNTLNEGKWQVIAQTANSLTLARNNADIFSALGEVVSITANSQFQVFSSAGVQIGDMVDISNAFQGGAQRSWNIVGVTANRIEIESGAALANETGIVPGVNGMVFYQNCKRIVFFEADQECYLRLNGATDNTTIITPVIPGTDARGGFYCIGRTWKMEVVNRTNEVLGGILLTAE